MLQYNLTCLHFRLKIPQWKDLTKNISNQPPLLYSPFLMFSFGSFTGPTVVSPQATFHVSNAYRAWKKLLGQGYNLFSPCPGSTPKHKYPKGPRKHQKRMEKGVRSFPPGAEPALTYLSANHSIPFCSWPPHPLLLLHTWE